VIARDPIFLEGTSCWDRREIKRILLDVLERPFVKTVRIGF